MRWMCCTRWLADSFARSAMAKQESLLVCSLVMCMGATIHTLTRPVWPSDLSAYAEVGAEEAKHMSAVRMHSGVPRCAVQRVWRWGRGSCPLFLRGGGEQHASLLHVRKRGMKLGFYYVTVIPGMQTRPPASRSLRARAS